MKLRHFFYAAILTAGITACSDDDNVANSQNPTDVHAYMTLQIVGPQGANTKTKPNPDGDGDGSQSGDTQTGTTAENTISRVLVLLCDNNNAQIKAIYDVKNDLEEISGGVKTPVIATQTGTYQVYVIANPTDAVVTALTPTEGTASSTKATDYTITGVTETLMKNNYAANNNFIMFNESNGTDDTAGETITITEANDYDHPAQCANAIRLDRLAVKINSQKGQNLDISGIKTDAADQESEFDAVASVDLKGFKLLNGATQANLQQKWTGTTPTAYPWTNTLVTPQLANNTTGYYNHLTDFRTVTTGADGSYTAAQDLYDKVNVYGSSAKEPIYCMENNPTYKGTGITEALNGNTTGLVYQWQVTLTDGSSDEKAGKNCFYAYDGNYYGKLSDLINDYPGVVKEVTGTDLAAKIKVVEEGLAAAYAKTGDERQKAISDFRVKYNIKVYTEGIMYYTYYIKDQNYKQVEETGKAAVNYYSVMRNTVYNLNITKLMRIGTDIPGGWNPETDPDDPVDPTEVYMTIQAIANPWVVSKEDITLE